MTNSNSIYVYAKLSESTKAVIAGRLDFFEQRVDFRYAKSWLDSPSRFAFHPELLPLNQNVYSAKTLDGALSVFRDAGPGIWGKELINRRYGKVDLPDYLILSNNLLRIGIFRYSRDSDSLDLSTTLNDYCNTIDIDDIYVAIKAMENGEQLTDFQSSILALGSSMDGMRPKSFVEIDSSSWILKFPSKNDYDNKAINELIGMGLARACGIEAPDVKLISLRDNRNAVAVKRFDTNGKDNFPLMSVASAMGYTEGEFMKKDYRYVAQMLIRLSFESQADCISLFKRMALNVMISNKDDHIFNQAMIMQNGQWKLSPVYDVVCGEGNRRNHAMIIGKLDSKGSLENVLSSAGSFGLNEVDAKFIIDDMIEIVSERWKKIAKEGGVIDEDIAQIEWSILNKDIFNSYVIQDKPLLSVIWNAEIATRGSRGPIKAIFGAEVIQHIGQGKHVVWNRFGLHGVPLKVGMSVIISEDGEAQLIKEKGVGVGED